MQSTVSKTQLGYVIHKSNRQLDFVVTLSFRILNQIFFFGPQRVTPFIIPVNGLVWVGEPSHTKPYKLLVL